MKHRVSGSLESMGKGGWTLLHIPAEVTDALGTRARVAIHGTINGVEFRGMLVPLGEGAHALPVVKTVQAAARVGPGSKVDMIFQVDDKPRPVEIPEELANAMKKAPAATRKAFDALAPSHKKAWAQWVGDAKREETRARRAAETVRRLGEGEKNPNP